VPFLSGTQNQADFSTAASSAADEPRQRGPLGEHLTDAELLPIRVHTDDGSCWQVDYGSYVQGYHDSREEAIVEALAAAVWENRELTIERPRRISETDLRTDVNETASSEFRLDDTVRLLDQQRDVPSGGIGRVLGIFPRPVDPTYAVSFTDKKVTVLELRPHEFALVEDSRVASDQV
jgi:hypothetical protein